MAEPTLTLPLADLQAEVGLFLGYGRGSDGGESAWDVYQAAAIDGVVRSGLRQFYTTIAAPDYGVPAAYQWSFLRPTVDLDLEAGATAVPLPADVGGLEGRVTLVDSTHAYCPVAITSPESIRASGQLFPTKTGRPEYAAVRPLKGAYPDRGQKFELVVFPAADRAYTLRAECYLMPDALTAGRPYAYGGPEHAETLKASCIAAAEVYLDDAKGARWTHFLERLGASVGADRQRKAQLVGYNGDRSDGYERHGFGRRGWPQTAVVTYGGVNWG